MAEQINMQQYHPGHDPNQAVAPESAPAPANFDQLAQNPGVVVTELAPNGDSIALPPQGMEHVDGVVDALGEAFANGRSHNAIGPVMGVVRAARQQGHFVGETFAIVKGTHDLFGADVNGGGVFYKDETPAVLLLKQDGGQPEVIGKVTKDKPVEVGRNHQTQGTLGKEVSGNHFVVWEDEAGEIRVGDRGSTNGTEVAVSRPAQDTVPVRIGGIAAAQTRQ